MIRISKLTDYGIILLTYFTQDESASLSARELAARSHIPLPTVGKILKLFSRAEILVSQRGVRGGYRLARSSEKISAAEVISLFEGPIALTDCSGHGGGCGFMRDCPARGHWQKINGAMLKALNELSLREISTPVSKAGDALLSKSH